MDTLEIIGYASLGVLVVLMVGASVAGLFTSSSLLVGILVVVGFGALLIKVIKDRIGNKEDDHYSDTVDQ
ncbi:MAG: hypothetical protein R2834_23670 [Rhodothermales bacterium]